MNKKRIKTSKGWQDTFGGDQHDQQGNKKGYKELDFRICGVRSNSRTSVVSTLDTCNDDRRGDVLMRLPKSIYLKIAVYGMALFLTFIDRGYVFLMWMRNYSNVPILVALGVNYMVNIILHSKLNTIESFASKQKGFYKNKCETMHFLFSATMLYAIAQWLTMGVSNGGLSNNCYDIVNFCYLSILFLSGINIIYVWYINRFLKPIVDSQGDVIK